MRAPAARPAGPRTAAVHVHPDPPAKGGVRGTGTGQTSAERTRALIAIVKGQMDALTKELAPILAADKKRWARERPDPRGQPRPQFDYMQKEGACPWLCYPEWNWSHTGNRLEARAVVQLGDNDYVHWYVSPTGAWSYSHQWSSSPFDVVHAIGKATDLVKAGVAAAGAGLHAIGQPFAAALDKARDLAKAALDKVASVLPPQARIFVEALKQAVDVSDVFVKMELDPEAVDWRTLAHDVEAATSAVPVLGTAAADVIATCEVIYDAATAGNALEAALRAAYDYAMASVPGAAALRSFLDPVVDVLIRIAAGGEAPTAAVLHAAVMQAPDAPKIGSLSPRSIAAALGAFVGAKLGVR